MGALVLAVTAAAAAVVVRERAGGSQATVVVGAAGDIACDPSDPAFDGGRGSATACRQRATSDLLLALHPQAVLALGDTQYTCASLAAYRRSYAGSWGRLKAITHATTGNHEYIATRAGRGARTGCDPANRGARGYFDYFGAAGGPRGQGYTSWDLGAWHMVSLNSQCHVVSCAAGSAQERWLRADLAAHGNRCTLAYMHIPIWSSGPQASRDTAPLVRDLYAAHVDLLLTGHDHDYERFAPQADDGSDDPAGGLREFVVGTGGDDHHHFTSVQPDSVVRNDDTFGVLALTLRPAGYAWRFVPEPGHAFRDSGSAPCHSSGSTGDLTTPTTPSGLKARARPSGPVALSWARSHDPDDRTLVYRITRSGTSVGSTTRPRSDDAGVLPIRSYAYAVTACDPAGNCSQPSAPVVVSTPPPAGRTVQTLAPLADARVAASTPTVNDGRQTTLRVDASPPVRSYLHFDLGSSRRPVSAATLRIWANSAQSPGLVVAAARDGRWTERGITWADQPGPSPAGARAASGPVPAGSWLAVDVTALARHRRTLDLVLETTGSTSLSLASREDRRHAPQLVVERARRAPGP